MEPHPDPDPSLRERRILVLHNRDFEPEGEASDPGALARIDVLNAARDVGRALVSRGHFVEVQGIDQRDLGDLLAQLSEDAPDLVFNLCESLNGDAHSETVVPTLLDLLRVPYTGSGPLTLGLCVRKDLTKHLLHEHGVTTPPGVVLPAAPRARALDVEAVAAIGYPVIVKLVAEDASVGITLTSVVDSDEALLRRVAALREQHRQPILVERYIDGRELYVAMLGDRPPRILPVQELEYADWPAGAPRILSYDTKWDPRAPTYHRTSSQPARGLPPGVEERAIAMAQRCFEVRGVALPWPQSIAGEQAVTQRHHRHFRAHHRQVRSRRGGAFAGGSDRGLPLPARSQRQQNGQGTCKTGSAIPFHVETLLASSS